MNSMLEYKGYHASVKYDADDNILVGEVFGITDSLNFHGTSIKELEKMFHNSIDNYLELCEKIGKIPEKEFKGSFNIRISPEVHKQIALVAAQKDISLNQYVANVIEESLNPKKNTEQLIMYFPKKCVGAYFKLSKQQTQKNIKKIFHGKKKRSSFAMQNKEIEILSHKISDIQISIDDDVKEKFEMQIDSRSKIREPINDNDTTLLLNLELNINSKDEMLNISIISDVIFDLHALYNDYEEIAEKELVPMAMKEISFSLDQMLLIMGYSKLDIANKLNL